jgi:hypothetical protein
MAMRRVRVGSGTKNAKRRSARAFSPLLEALVAISATGRAKVVEEEGADHEQRRNEWPARFRPEMRPVRAMAVDYQASVTCQRADPAPSNNHTRCARIAFGLSNDFAGQDEPQC